MKNWLRLLLITELVIIAGLQLTFWSRTDGIRKVWELEHEIAIQNQTLAEHQRRNRMLFTEVEALKSDPDALEGKARLDLGLIREGETFFQLIE